MADFCQLWLTCKDTVEADTIASTLLEKHLVACAKQVPVRSDFLWQGKIDHNNEVALVMDSREDLFEQVEEVVAQLHSYETFVLQAVAIRKTSIQATQWLQDNLR